MQIVKQLSYGSRERNEVERPDYAAFDPVTALRSVPGCHCKTSVPGCHCKTSVPGCHCKTSALTLVELLVTISIMALVIAISLPMVKPMLESNKTKSGADIVAGFLAQARNRAIEEGRPVGVTFERILDYGEPGYYPYNGACVLMRQVAEPKPLSGFVKDVRVWVNWASVTTGNLEFCTWDNTSIQWANATIEKTYWNKLVKTGDQIQFGSQGAKYEITKQADNDFRIEMNSDANRNLALPVYSDQQPVLFKVFRKPSPGKVAPTMASPVALPEGIVVDLDCSGMGNSCFNESDEEWDVEWLVSLNASNAVRDQFCANGQSDDQSVTIMFSPTGEVDRVYYSKLNRSSKNTDIPSGPIFLNIGIWERAGFWMEGKIVNDYLPDAKPDSFTGKISGTRNHHDMNNYWVTVFPGTGAIRINRVAAPESRLTPNEFAESRKYAKSLHSAETR